MTTEPTSASERKAVVAYLDMLASHGLLDDPARRVLELAASAIKVGEHLGTVDAELMRLAATRLRSQPAPSSEEVVEIQQLRDEVAEWKERYNRKDGEYGRAIEAAYCCVRCGKPTPLAQARKEALEEAAGIAENCDRIIIRSEDREWNAACRSVADALRSRAGEIGGSTDDR